MVRWLIGLRDSSGGCGVANGLLYSLGYRLSHIDRVGWTGRGLVDRPIGNGGRLVVEEISNISWKEYLNLLRDLPVPLRLLCMPSYDSFVSDPIRLDLRKSLEVSASGEGGVCGDVV